MRPTLLPRTLGRCVTALVPLVLAGCATSLTTLQTAKTLEPMQVSVTASASLPIASSVVGGILDGGGAVVERLSGAEDVGRGITEAEQRQALATTTAVTLFQPGVYTELMGRIGVVKDVDAGLRFGGFILKGDGKWRFHEEGNTSVAADLGYTYHLSPAPSYLDFASELLDFVKLGDFSRHDLDASVIVSKDWDDLGGIYAAGKYEISFVSLDEDLEKVETLSGAPHTELSSRIHMFGVAAGVMLGYRYVFANLELTVMRIVFTPVILGEERDLSGLIVSPTLGLTARF